MDYICFQNIPENSRHHLKKFFFETLDNLHDVYLFDFLYQIFTDFQCSRSYSDNSLHTTVPAIYNHLKAAPEFGESKPTASQQLLLSLHCFANVFHTECVFCFIPDKSQYILLATSSGRLNVN